MFVFTDKYIILNHVCFGVNATKIYNIPATQKKYTSKATNYVKSCNIVQ